MSEEDILRAIISLMRLFGERYVYIDDDQALLDCKYCRENLVADYSAIMDAITCMTYCKEKAS